MPAVVSGTRAKNVFAVSRSTTCLGLVLRLMRVFFPVASRPFFTGLRPATAFGIGYFFAVSHLQSVLCDEVCDIYQSSSGSDPFTVRGGTYTTVSDATVKGIETVLVTAALSQGGETCGTVRSPESAICILWGASSHAGLNMTRAVCV